MKKNTLSKIIFTIKTIVVLILLFITFIFIYSLYYDSDLNVKNLKSKTVCNQSKELLFTYFAKEELLINRYNSGDNLDKIKLTCLEIIEYCAQDLIFNVENNSKEYFDSSFFLIKSCKELTRVEK